MGYPMTVEGIVNHLKELMNDNGSASGLFFSTLINRFQKLFAYNVNYNSLITSSSITTTSGTYYYNLGSNFIRPFDESSFYVKDSNTPYPLSVAQYKFAQRGGQAVNERVVYLIGGQEGVYFSAYIGTNTGETIDYWYLRMPVYLSAASMIPEIPDEAIIEGVKVLYKESNDMIDKNTMDQLLYQIYLQWNKVQCNIDEKADAYIVNTKLQPSTDPMGRRGA